MEIDTKIPNISQSETSAKLRKRFPKRHKVVTDTCTKEIEKWFMKTNLAKRKTNTKKFKALDVSVMQQVDMVKYLLCLHMS
eukprot:m.163256 g.163256  ORF g.163256 m.163256 type:complete len:81 (-) comp15216_c0_seq5:47-289(-)